MVLNGKGNQYGISKKTQATVLDAIARMNYAPSKFAKAQRTGKSYFVGLILSDIANPGYLRMARNLENELALHGYNLLVCNSGENEEKEKLQVEMLLNRQGVDALVVATTFKDASFYDRNCFSDFPMVFIDRTLSHMNAGQVIFDNYSGAFDMVSKLISSGSRTVACMPLTPLHLSTTCDRLNGYKRAMLKAGLEPDEHLLRPVGLDSVDEDVEKNLQYFIENKIIPEAVFALNFPVALALLRALKKREFLKLANMQIASYEDAGYFGAMDKRMITVERPYDDMGRAAAGFVLSLLRGEPQGPEQIVLPARKLSC